MEFIAFIGANKFNYGSIHSDLDTSPQGHQTSSSSEIIRVKFSQKNVKFWLALYTKQYLDNVENVNKNTVSGRVLFSPSFSMKLKIILTS